MICTECGKQIVVAKAGITPTQAHLLDIIIDYFDEHNHSPSIEDLRERMNVKSKTNVHRLLTALERRGRIRRQPHQARSIMIT